MILQPFPSMGMELNVQVLVLYIDFGIKVVHARHCVIACTATVHQTLLSIASSTEEGGACSPNR